MLSEHVPWLPQFTLAQREVDGHELLTQAQLLLAHVSVLGPEEEPPLQVPVLVHQPHPVRSEHALHVVEVEHVSTLAHPKAIDCLMSQPPFQKALLQYTTTEMYELSEEPISADPLL